jgi:hypothetical protein
MRRSASIKGWLLQHRSSARIAFLVQIGTRLLSSLLNLAWTRLLLAAMGPALNGLLLLFQSWIALAGLGDLGVGGAVAFTTSRLLGERNEAELRKFLGVARGFFVVVSAVGATIFIALTPWLRVALERAAVNNGGSSTLLIVSGGVMIGLLLLTSYTNSVNYGCANVLWPIVPTFLLLHLSFGAHWLLARHTAPLWVQYLPYVCAALLSLVLSWLYLRASFPGLANLLPLRFEWSITISLLEKSFWVFLYGGSGLLYVAVARSLVGKGFTTNAIPVYTNNYKLCELAAMVLSSATFVAMPKIAQLIVSSHSGEKQRGKYDLYRLSSFQILLSSAVALVYLAVNTTFVSWWLPDLPPAPLGLQAAFAAYLIVTAAGDCSMQGVVRCGNNGLRLAGIGSALGASLNFALAYACMRLHRIDGIAASAVVAQSLVSIVSGYYVCRFVGLPWLPWLARTWAAPLA